MTPEKKYAHHYREMAKICAEQGWGVADTFSGADAFNKNGEPVEYKSTTAKKVKGSYTGISVFDTWEEQVEYLRNEKIAKYPEHYYNRFENGQLVESWMLPGDIVFEILVPKMKKKFPTILEKKDPRLSASISNGEIKKYGEKII
jgi:hypothetical protein